MTSGETLLKIRDFPFAYSFAIIVIATLGYDAIESSIGILTIAGFVGTFLVITDPIGAFIKWITKFSLTQRKIEERSLFIPENLDLIKSALQVKAVNLEISKMVGHIYFIIALIGIISAIIYSDIFIKNFLFENNEMMDNNLQSFRIVGIFIISVAIVIVIIKFIQRYNELIEKIMVASIYRWSILSDDPTKTSIEKMQIALDESDWTIAKRWAERIRKETISKEGRKEEIRKSVQEVYSPLYVDSLGIQSTADQIIKTRHYVPFTDHIWSQIKNDHRYHTMDDIDFREILSEFYESVKNYNSLTKYAEKRVEKIIQSEGSKFYQKNVEHIDYYFLRGEGGRSAPGLEDCLMFEIHPKNVPEYKILTPFEIDVVHHEGGTDTAIHLKTKKDFENFDKLWEIMLNEIKKDEKITRMKEQYNKIKSENSRIQNGLIEKFH